jgi:putative ABC transport system permease protein
VKDLVRRLRGELSAVPGVTSVAAATNVPLHGVWNRRIEVEGYIVPDAKDTPFINASVITPGYFKTLGVPILEGRDFTEDDERTPRVTIVDDALAKQYWPGQSAIGKRVRYGPPDPNTPWHTIIGVVASIRNQSLVKAAPPDIYVGRRRAGAEHRRGVRQLLARVADDQNRPFGRAARMTLAAPGP